VKFERMISTGVSFSLDLGTSLEMRLESVVWLAQKFKERSVFPRGERSPAGTPLISWSSKLRSSPEIGSSRLPGIAPFLYRRRTDRRRRRWMDQRRYAVRSAHTHLRAHIPDHATCRRDGLDANAGVMPDVCVPWSGKDVPEIRIRRLTEYWQDSEPVGLSRSPQR
jgi:hypothetical protein